MSEPIKNFDLASFKRANKNMVAANDTYSDTWGSRKRVTRVKDYTIEEVEKIVQSGSLEDQVELSRNYFYKDGFYKRLIIHYATLLKYAGILIPNPSFGKSLSTSHIQKRYFNAVDFVERLNIPVLLTNFAQRALVDGCYYGVIQSESKEGIIILDLPSRWCCTRFKDTLGNDIVEFNVSYFNSILDKNERKKVLKTYPKIISSAYQKWVEGKLSSSWIFIPGELGICFPFFDSRPLFLSTIPETIRYEDSVDIEMERNAEEIRKILVQKVPHLSDGRLLFEPDEAEEMHTGAVGMLKGSRNIKVLTTYADVDTITSKASSENVHNALEQMAQNIYSTTGASSELFSSTGSSTLDSSIKNDIALMMILANKFSLFLTKLINRLYENSNINFKYTILPISYYNEDKYVDTSFKLASSGYSFLLPGLALGFSQKDLGNVKELENDVLKLADKLIPLQTSYTQSNSGESGAPKKDQEDKAPKTLQNEESLDNQTGGGSN